MRTPRAGLPAASLPAACLLLVTGCSSLGGGQASPPADTGPPASANQCDFLPLIHGDPGVVAGFDWPEGEQQYGARVTLYACVQPLARTSVVLTSTSPDVEVTPRLQAVLPGGSGVLPFVVTVRQGAQGSSIEMRHLAVGRTKPLVEMRGPTVVADPDGWHFEAPQT